MYKPKVKLTEKGREQTNGCESSLDSLTDEATWISHRHYRHDYRQI